MSARVVRVGKVGVHPKADNLQITCVDGRCTIFPTGDYAPGDLAVYVEPGTVVPTDRPEFAWLSNRARTKVRKAYLRGVPSYGFLIPYEEGDGPEGADVSEYLGIEVPRKPVPPTLWQRIVAWVVGS